MVLEATPGKELKPDKIQPGRLTGMLYGQVKAGAIITDLLPEIMSRGIPDQKLLLHQNIAEVVQVLQTAGQHIHDLLLPAEVPIPVLLQVAEVPIHGLLPVADAAIPDLLQAAVPGHIIAHRAAQGGAVPTADLQAVPEAVVTPGLREVPRQAGVTVLLLEAQEAVVTADHQEAAHAAAIAVHPAALLPLHVAAAQVARDLPAAVVEAEDNNCYSILTGPAYLAGSFFEL